MGRLSPSMGTKSFKDEPAHTWSFQSTALAQSWAARRCNLPLPFSFGLVSSSKDRKKESAFCSQARFVLSATGSPGSSTRKCVSRRTLGIYWAAVPQNRLKKKKQSS